MKIVLDLQEWQREKQLGVGDHHSLAFAKALLTHCSLNEIVLAVSGSMPETVEELRTILHGLILQDNICVWHTPEPGNRTTSSNQFRHEAAQLIREAFLASFQPDIIHTFSSFTDGTEGLVNSIGKLELSIPVSVTLYDLKFQTINGVNFGHNTNESDFNPKNIISLRKANLIFATSENLRKRVIEVGGIDSIKVINIGGSKATSPEQVAQHSIADRIPEAQADEGRSDTTMLHESASSLDSFWMEAAATAIAAWQKITNDAEKNLVFNGEYEKKPRMAFISPLPPARTGIADYCAELLPALAQYYDIDVILDQDITNETTGIHHDKIHTVSWLYENIDKIDRVLYHIGNAPFHAHMLQLLKNIPGTVVLHDFYLGHLYRWIEATDAHYEWRAELYNSHGYTAVKRSYSDPEKSCFDFPVNWAVLQNAKGLIVHSDYARNLAKEWYGRQDRLKWKTIPLLRANAIQLDKENARKKIGFQKQDFIVCSFGFLGATKLNHLLIEAWLNSALSDDPTCHLLFVGQNADDDYGSDLLKRVYSSKAKDRIHITGFTQPEIYRQYLTAADLAVQLRAQSRGETSAAVLDCMNYGVPLIANANGSKSALDPNAIYLLPDYFNCGELSEALESLWGNPLHRQSLSLQASTIVREFHSPEKCAKQYAETIEHFYQSDSSSVPCLIEALAAGMSFGQEDIEFINVSNAIAKSIAPMKSSRSLFLDISATLQNDLKTGIERVARALMLAFLQDPPPHYRVEPVYLCNEDGVWFYRHACQYTFDLLNCPSEKSHDLVALPVNGDVLITLDMSGSAILQAGSDGLFSGFRQQGVSVYAIVFDLLPVQLPEKFPPGADQRHKQWLEAISQFDGAMCISESVAKDLAEWQRTTLQPSKNRRPFSINWFHLGADVHNSVPSRGYPEDAVSTLMKVNAHPSFLMVGTIEPRKGHLQTLAAFEKLWSQDSDACLVIVGSEGWKGLPEEQRREIPLLVHKLRTHRELNKRLFWLEGISDEYLEKIYGSCICLIAASYGEGFGLPSIEASKHGLAIIARDIPVFREVAGDHASYFATTSADGMALFITEWLSNNAKEKKAEKVSVPFLTWLQSKDQLMDRVHKSLGSGNATLYT